MEFKKAGVEWEHSFEEAMERAKREQKPFLLDFFKDGWAGCAKLGAVTYPDFCVSAAINKYFVPLQINVDAQEDLAEKFRVVWTPNINFLDPEGNIFYHVEGWLPPSDYSAMLMVAHAHDFLHHKNFQKARELFQTVWDKYPQSAFAPEALYYLGVSRYKDSHKGDELIKGWRVLQRFHPESTWAIRSSVL